MSNIKENFAYQTDEFGGMAFFVLHLGPSLHVSTKKDMLLIYSQISGTNPGKALKCLALSGQRWCLRGCVNYAC